MRTLTPRSSHRWVGSDSGQSKPVRIASENENLAEHLKKALSYVRSEGKQSG